MVDKISQTSPLKPLIVPSNWSKVVMEKLVAIYWLPLTIEI
jgi:hypothetical protein